MLLILPRTLLSTLILIIITLIVNSLPALIPLKYGIFAIFASILSILILIYIIVSGYRIGKILPKRYAFFSGILTGFGVAFVSGILIPIIQVNSTTYHKMIYDLVSYVPGSSSTPPFIGFTFVGFLTGLLSTSLFYGFASFFASIYGEMKRENRPANQLN